MSPLIYDVSSSILFYSIVKNPAIGNLLTNCIKMPRKFAKKGLKKSKSVPKSAPRRKLVGPWGVAAGGAALYKGYKTYSGWKRGQAKKAKTAFDLRVSQTDNVTTAKSCLVGKPKPLSFEEKVARVNTPPYIFKRNYAFSSESTSGRKGIFYMKVNDMQLAQDLTADISTYKSSLYTNTGSPNPAIAANAFDDGFRAYVDYCSDKIQMVNSSSNTVTGKIYLIGCKRDMDATYATTNTPLNPVNMMMYYSTFRVNNQSANFEGTVGNGWKFDTATAGVNYQANYNSPGSTLNTGGATAQIDPQLSLFSSHIKDGMDFWFNVVDSLPFSLKPGQQINKSYIFNNLPTIKREQTDYSSVSGITYFIVVEFQGGIVGDSQALATNVVSTGDSQLSVIREQKRILGAKSAIKSRVLLQTAPLTGIAIANQVIINADTGVQLSGTIVDP